MSMIDCRFMTFDINLILIFSVKQLVQTLQNRPITALNLKLKFVNDFTQKKQFLC